MAITTKDRLIKLKMLDFCEFPQLLSYFCPTDFPAEHVSMFCIRFGIKMPKKTLFVLYLARPQENSTKKL